MNVNLDKYFDTQKPTITIFGKAYDVDNDYKKVLGVQGLAADLGNDVKSMKKFLTYSLVKGETAANEILSHSMPFPVLEKLQFAIVAAMTGEKMEEIEKQFKEAQTPSFRDANSAKKRV